MADRDNRWPWRTPADGCFLGSRASAKGAIPRIEARQIRSCRLERVPKRLGRIRRGRGQERALDSMLGRISLRRTGVQPGSSPGQASSGKCSGEPLCRVADQAGRLLVLLSVRHENHLLGHLLKGLPSSERAALEMELKEFLPRQGSVLQQASELIELIHFPHGGIVSLWTIVDGKAVDAAMVGREGAIGIEASLGESSSFTRAVV